MKQINVFCVWKICFIQNVKVKRIPIKTNYTRNLYCISRRKNKYYIALKLYTLNLFSVIYEVYDIIGLIGDLTTIRFL